MGAPGAALAVAAGGAWTAEGGPMVTEASGADGPGAFRSGWHAAVAPTGEHPAAARRRRPAAASAAAAFGQADVDGRDAPPPDPPRRLLDCGDLLADDDRQAAVKRPASWIVEQFAAPPERPAS